MPDFTQVHSVFLVLAGMGIYLLKDLVAQLRPAHLATKNDIQQLKDEFQKELSAHSQSCGGPHGMREDISKLFAITASTNTGVARIEGALEARGWLEKGKS